MRRRMRNMNNIPGAQWDALATAHRIAAYLAVSFGIHDGAAGDERGGAGDREENIVCMGVQFSTATAIANGYADGVIQVSFYDTVGSFDWVFDFLLQFVRDLQNTCLGEERSTLLSSRDLDREGPDKQEGGNL